MKLRVPREPFFGVAEFDGIVPGLELRTSMGDGSEDEPPVQFHGHDPLAPSVPQDTDKVLAEAYAGSDAIFDAAFSAQDYTAHNSSESRATLVQQDEAEGLHVPPPHTHPDYCEKGIELPLGFIPHRGENRTQRRAAVANFSAEGADRRELWAQRQRQRRGKLDPELRRLQRQKAKAK